MTSRRAAIGDWSRTHRDELAWGLLVALVYGGVTIGAALTEPPAVDRAMTLAIHFSQGRLDIGGPVTGTDTLTINGSTYWVVGPLVFLPFLPFVPFDGLWEASRWIVPAGFGIMAAWLMLPLARRYGPGGRATWWLAILGAFGTLLFNQALRGNDYYLTHAEAMLFTVIALVEWQGRRRAWVDRARARTRGARPSARAARGRPVRPGAGVGGPGRPRRLVAFATPIAVSIGRGGRLQRGALRVAVGDRLRHLRPDQRRAREESSARRPLAPSRAPQPAARCCSMASATGGASRSSCPISNGHSILLTSPALLAAVGAGIRSRTAAVLWASVVLITAVLLVYYGGGGRTTYGYRYFLDATPFLLALTAMAARRQFGALERLLIVMSVGFVSYGFVWLAFRT